MSNATRVTVGPSHSLALSSLNSCPFAGRAPLRMPRQRRASCGSSPVQPGEDCSALLYPVKLVYILMNSVGLQRVFRSETWMPHQLNWISGATSEFISEAPPSA